MVYSDKDTGVRNSNFMAKTQFLCRSEIYTDRFIIKLDFKMNGKDKEIRFILVKCTLNTILSVTLDPH